MIDYSIIIVNYKTPQLILDCLRTVFIPEATRKFEVIIVDNASGDESKTMIQAAFPEVIWIQLDYNAGFARGNNAGIRIARSSVVLLLNSDTLNEGNAIDQCVERLLSSECIAAGVQLLNLDRTPQISGNFFMKGGLNHLMTLPYTGRVIRAVGLLLNVKKTNVPNATSTVDVDWINGAFLMVKKSAFEQAGLLDEDFFLYSEEIEWCARLREIGKLCIYGDLHVVHLMGATTSKAFLSKSTGYTELSDRKGLQLMVSGFLRIRKQFGSGWLTLHLLAYVFTIPVYFIITLFRSIIFPGTFIQEWRNWWGFTANTFRVITISPKIYKNKPHFYKVL